MRMVLIHQMANSIHPEQQILKYGGNNIYYDGYVPKPL